MAIRLKVATGQEVVFPTPPGVNEKRIMAALDRLNEVRGISLNSAGRLLMPKEQRHFVWVASELAALQVKAIQEKRESEAGTIRKEMADYMTANKVDAVTAAEQIYKFPKDEAAEFVKDIEKLTGPFVVEEKA